MGECPAWYPVLTAAERLRCPPWELLDPDDDARAAWINLANGASNAEAYARKTLRERSGR